MRSLFQGRIVYVRDPVSDPQGNNPKENRPFVVISPQEVIDAKGEVLLVGISKSQETKAELAVELPHGYQSKTKLRVPCFAVCNWLINRSRTDFDVGDGYIKPKQLKEILEKSEGHSPLED